MFYAKLYNIYVYAEWSTGLLQYIKQRKNVKRHIETKWFQKYSIIW